LVPITQSDNEITWSLLMNTTIIKTPHNLADHCTKETSWKLSIFKETSCCCFSWN